MSLLTRQVETARTAGVITYNDKTWEVGFALTPKLPGGGRPVKRVRRYRDQEEARRVFAHLVQNIDAFGGQLGLRFV